MAMADRKAENGQSDLAASLRRIGAMVLRYWYLIRSSWPRILELVYWPFVQMLMWGFLQLHLHQRHPSTLIPPIGYANELKPTG